MLLHPTRFCTALTGPAAIAAAIVLLHPAPSSLTPPSDIAANEAAAIASLRRIFAAQEELRSSVGIETNCDGLGEYGYFAELAATRPHRVSVGCAPATGLPSDVLSPPLLGPSFGNVHHSRTVRDGYMFQMWLPFTTVAGLVSAVQEDPDGGKQAPPYPDPANGARYWCCYAWPLRLGQSGRRAFFVNQLGVVLQCRNRGVNPYEGNVHPPAFWEAFQIMIDMSSPLRLDTPGGADNTVWRRVP